MRLEDYYDAVAFVAAGKAPLPEKWVDELRHREELNSFGSIG